MVPAVRAGDGVVVAGGVRSEGDRVAQPHGTWGQCTDHAYRGAAGEVTGTGPSEAQEAHILHLKARAAYNANKHTNGILPRLIYEEPGKDVPPNATDELQIMPKERWWQRLRAS